MVAYSYKRRFVEPILVGLGVMAKPLHPKRQTIRAVGLKRHARPGERVQLYHGLRTKHCFLIGEARCTSVEKIFIRFHKKRRMDWVRVGAVKLDRPDQLDEFARADGFYDWQSLRWFWFEEHGLSPFNGLLIKWEPLHLERGSDAAFEAWARENRARATITRKRRGDYVETKATRKAIRRSDEREPSKGA